MILTCPACGTRYLVPDAAIGAEGRRVKCTRCSHLWRVAAPAGLDSDEARERDRRLRGEAEPIRVHPEPRPRPIPPGSGLPARPVPRRRLAPWVGWLFFAVVVAGILAGLWFGRDRIMVAWPPSERLYDAIGVGKAPVGAGLEIRNIGSMRRQSGGQDVVEVEGVLVNVGGDRRPVPDLRVGLLDTNGAEVASRIAPPPVGELAADESAGFVFRFTSVPAAAQATVRFVAPGGAAAGR